MEQESNPNLVIDVGNTLTKLAVFSSNDLVHVEKVSGLTTSILDDIISSFGAKTFIVSAVGSFSEDFSLFLENKGQLINFSSSLKFLPINNCYKTPDTLGSDRLAGVIAANWLYPKTNVLVIDSGTAITYDLVTSNGEYIGGAISPGINMRFRALNEFTAKLPLLKSQKKFPLIGDSTEESILAGVLKGSVGEVDTFINEVKAKYSDLKIVFTGGDAFFFDKNLKNSIFVNPNLVLIGLNRFLNYYNEQF